MICPKCHEGFLTTVKIKSNKRIVTNCDLCETLWFEQELISEFSGHPFTVIKNGGEIDYVIDESETEDQDHRSANYRRNS